MKRNIIFLTCSFALLLMCNTVGRAQTEIAHYAEEDVWTAYKAFNDNLLDSKTHIYKRDTQIADGAHTRADLGAVWTQATFWDMTMNAYKLADREGNNKKKKECRRVVEEVFEGNKAHYSLFDWHNQTFENGWFIYDDIMWWTIAQARAYELFHEKKYLNLAEESFCRVWYGSYKLKDRGSYDKVEGGMFWSWNNAHPSDNSDKGKMSCINFPTVIAALTLYSSLPIDDKKHEMDDKKGWDGEGKYPRWLSRKTYYSNAATVYAWAEKNLFNEKTGNVADCRHENNVNWGATMYNQGTFIGASCLMYKDTGEKRYLENAIKAAEYARNVMSVGKSHLLPFQPGEEQGIYTAIFAQYMAMLVYDCDQKQFLPWIRQNIDIAWTNRNEQNLMGKDSSQKPKGIVSCYDASGIPSLMLLFPPEKSPACLNTKK